MGIAASDNFNEAGPINLSARTPSGGGTWANHVGFSFSNIAVEDNRIHNDANSAVNVAYHSVTPGSADYDVVMGLVMKSDNNDSVLGPAGRIDTGANTGYMALYNTIDNTWFLRKEVAASATGLGTASATLTPEQVYVLMLRMVGDQISLYVDGALTIGPVTDSSITAAGKAGIWTYGIATAATGLNGDYWQVDDPSVVATGASGRLWRPSRLKGLVS